MESKLETEADVLTDNIAKKLIRKYSKDIYVDEFHEQATVPKFASSAEDFSEAPIFDNDAISVTSFASIRIRNKNEGFSTRGNISFRQKETFDNLHSKDRPADENNDTKLEDKTTNLSLENNLSEEKQPDKNSLSDVVEETTTNVVSPDELVKNDTNEHSKNLHSKDRPADENNDTKLEDKTTNLSLENNLSEEKQPDKNSLSDVVEETTTNVVSPDELVKNDTNEQTIISELLNNKSNLN